jgi:hypothetical protein
MGPAVDDSADRPDALHQRALERLEHAIEPRHGLDREG